jgi:hypothetical protein
MCVTDAIESENEVEASPAVGDSHASVLSMRRLSMLVHTMGWMTLMWVYWSASPAAAISRFTSLLVSAAGAQSRGGVQGEVAGGGAMGLKWVLRTFVMSGSNTWHDTLQASYVLLCWCCACTCVAVPVVPECLHMCCCADECLL